VWFSGRSSSSVGSDETHGRPAQDNDVTELAVLAHHVGPLTGTHSEPDMCSVCVYVHVL